MKKYFAVGIGGALGTVIRHCIQMIPLNTVYRPLLTMLINISGSFLLGFLIILFVRLVPVTAEIRLGVTTGCLGGYTTFSTFCKESVLLYLSGHILFSAAYAVFSILLGIAAAWLGIFLAKCLERRRVS